MPLLIFDWIIYFNSSSWFNFFTKLFNIAYFWFVTGSWTEIDDVNDDLVYLYYLNGARLDAFWFSFTNNEFIEMLSRLEGIDILIVVFELDSWFGFRDNLRYNVGLFYLSEILN